MKDSHTTPALALMRALMTVALLAACTPASTGSTGTDPSTPAAESTPVSTSGDVSTAGSGSQVGEVLAQKPEQLAENFKAYELADSTYAVVDPSRPLPEVVRADIQSRVDSRIQDPGTPDSVGTNRSTIIDTAQETASLAGLQSGKSVVVIFPLVGSCISDEEAYLGWAHTAMTGADDGCRVLRTGEESRAEVGAGIAPTGEAERDAVFGHGN